MDYAKLSEVPEETRKLIRYKVAVEGLRHSQLIYCAAYEVDATGLHCFETLSDTSTRHQGVVLEPRLSQCKELHFGGECSWSVRPLEDGELLG